ncbi:hypothetical protein FGO68_gene11916 [Halteria grandinella]|uniref:Uncharacterized protein n=1 Tax=Halteria grandinella TaxID=5974 RepID=A0A8J8NIP1_HALGN|nr:hypothetical protein FGO68_gene11916 [Halteria grandinella]
MGNVCVSAQQKEDQVQQVQQQFKHDVASGRQVDLDSYLRQFMKIQKYESCVLFSAKNAYAYWFPHRARDILTVTSKSGEPFICVHIEGFKYSSENWSTHKANFKRSCQAIITLYHHQNMTLQNKAQNIAEQIDEWGPWTKVLILKNQQGYRFSSCMSHTMTLADNDGSSITYICFVPPTWA